MFKASCVFFFVILVTQFHPNAGLDWVAFFDRWIFGSTNKPGHITYSSVLLEGENAEKKYIDNEVHIVSRPKILKAQIEQNTLDIDKWYEYHKSANFIMRYIAEYAMDTLWEKRELLYEQYEEAKEDIDLEPFCHIRYHNHNENEVDVICRKAFENRYFHDKGWFLYEDAEYGSTGSTHCSRVTVSRIQMNEQQHYPKLSYYREARRCTAYTTKNQDSSKMDTAAEKQHKGKMKKILRYLKFWEEKKVQVAAYVEM